MHIGRRGPDGRIAPRLLRGQERKRAEETKFGGRGSWVPRGIEERWLKYWQDWLQGAENSSVGGVAVCECAGRFAACFLGRCEGSPSALIDVVPTIEEDQLPSLPVAPSGPRRPYIWVGERGALRSIGAHLTVFSLFMCAKEVCAKRSKLESNAGVGWPG